MARADSPVEALLIQVLAQAVTLPLKAAGFRKSGTNYHRRRGDTVQVVNIQIRRSTSGTEKEFYVNVGLALDAICELAELPVIDRPKDFDCDERGTRDRLQGFISKAPDSWVLRVDEATNELILRLRGCMEQLVVELNRIDGLATYRGHPWFERFRPAPVNAQVLYLLGDLAGAWREVQDLATKFADRQNADRAEWWLETLRLPSLGKIES
jgi:hypothetical protein